MSRRAVIPAGLLIAGFAVMALLRLNGFCLLEPDSPDYLFTSKALANFQGYTEIDHPAQPPHAFRPPGLPLLLVPFSRLFPLQPLAAKLFVMASALAGLGLLFVVARRALENSAGALAALALMVTTPYTLLHATEIVTEMPYLAALLATLWLTMRSEPPGRGARIAMAVLLSLLPLLRTVGLVWIVALALWSLLARSRRWLPEIVVALGVNALWVLRNQRTGALTYFSGMVHDFETLGLTGYLAKAADAAGYYVYAWFDVLLPGVFEGKPLYDRFLLTPSPDLGGLWGIGWAFAAVITTLAVAGCLHRRQRDGGLVLLYGLGLVAALLVYPPRHERLIWPLVPMVWIYAPVGFALLQGRLARGKGAASEKGADGETMTSAQRAPYLVAAGFVVLLTAWQWAPTLGMVRTNLDWMLDRDGFQERTLPPMYYADWRAAGEWLAEHAPDGATVLTRHSDIGFTSGLPQDSVRFEEISPTDLHRRIAALKATYLAMPSTLCRWLAPSHLLQGSPVYNFEPVYEQGDVLLLQVRPNRSGEESPVVATPELEMALGRCIDAMERLPERQDIRRRSAQLVWEIRENPDEALKLLSPLQNAEAWTTRGQIHLDAGEPREAATAYEQAANAAGAGELERTITRGQARADRLLQLQERDQGDALAEEFERIRGFLRGMQFLSAGLALKRMLPYGEWEELHEDNVADDPLPAELRPTRDLLLGEWYERTGQLRLAERAYARSAAAGDRNAQALGQRLEQELRLRTNDSDSPPAVWIALATDLAGRGHIGRALLLLEQAAERHPASAEIHRRLGEIRGFYGVSAQLD
ncbi:hypothetical protein ABI59_11400 [Acidobacteria bacterium Mor1]|nr:hypothetical protein ABI59_11400 [Acidobacteria bacterium Mor1]